MRVILLSLLSAMLLSACASDYPLKAPCYTSGSNCWPRTKINQWHD